MAELFASGHIVDLILGLMALEALTLVTVGRLRANGAGAALACNLAAGAALMVALRCALTGAHWHWLALALLAALAGHLGDLALRGRR